MTSAALNQKNKNNEKSQSIARPTQHSEALSQPKKMGEDKIYISTRKSPLALWQANKTQELLNQQQYDVELIPIVTTGDKLQKGALADINLGGNSAMQPAPANTVTQPSSSTFTTGKGLFVKEIQDSLLQKKSSIAVHSMKDLPVVKTAELITAGVLQRAEAEDVLILSPKVQEALINQVTNEESQAWQLPNIGLQCLGYQRLKLLLARIPEFVNSAVGTTSARRQALMKLEFGGSLSCVILRGNVDSRLKKVQENAFGAILLARAGLERLKIFSPQSMYILPKDIFIPAPAQGVIALECRESALPVRQAIGLIACKQTALAAAIERLALWMLGGDCHTAIGAHWHNNKLWVFCSTAVAVTQTVFTPTEAALSELAALHCKHNGFYQGLFDSLRMSLFAKSLYTELHGRQFSTLLPAGEMHWNNQTLQEY